MKRISVEQAINSGAWFEYRHNEVTLRIRFLNFRLVQLNEFENIDRANSSLPLKDGKLFLLTIELINFSKNDSGSFYVSLEDSDGFTFEPISDNYITSSSDFAERNKLNIYSFIPKFKYIKSYIFLVPNEDTKYFLSTQYDSSLTEI